jgi:hypothetical protein
MDALQKFVVRGLIVAAGALVFACSSTITTGSGDGGASSSGGSSSGGSDASTDASGDSAVKGDAGGDAATCTAVDLKFEGHPACDTCIATNCAPELSACFGTVSPLGCGCQEEFFCIQKCGENDATCQDACTNDADTILRAFEDCATSHCGADGGTGECPF